MPNKLLYLICGLVTRWEQQYLVRGIWGRIQPVSRFCGCCGKGLAPLVSILQTAGSQQQLLGTAQEGEIRAGRNYSLPSPAASHLGTTRSCLAGKAAAGGLQRASPSRKTQLSFRSRAVYTLSSHLGCLLQVLQVLYLYPRFSGIC